LNNILTYLCRLFFVQETAIQAWLVIGNFTMGNMHRLHTTVRFMVFNANFNNISAISWQLVLLMEEIGVPGENHPVLFQDF
jgi:hypothetical protein